MNVRSLFAIAAVIAIGAVAGIAYFLVPEKVWNYATLCSMALLCLAAGFSIFAPFSMPAGEKGGDAATMASLGPMGVVVSALLAWSAATVVVAIEGHEKIAWAMMVANVASFAIANLILRGTAGIVDRAAAATPSGLSAQALWRGQISTLASAATNQDAKLALRLLNEKVQYAASESAGAAAEVNQQIAAGIASMHSCVIAGDRPSEELITHISRTSHLLDQREAILRASRSKA
jgi:hypothetical protein